MQGNCNSWISGIQGIPGQRGNGFPNLHKEEMATQAFQYGTTALVASIVMFLTTESHLL